MRTFRTARRIGWLAGVAGLALVAGPETWAQSPQPGVAVTAPTPARAPREPEPWLQRSAPLEQEGAREQEFYPGLVRSRHDPAFVRPLTTSVPTSETSSVRAGLSGWTAPALPFDIPQATGGVAFGLSIQWDGPAGEAEPRPAPAGTQR